MREIGRDRGRSNFKLERHLNILKMAINNVLEICRQLEEKGTRVKLYLHPDKGNHGVGASRNLGLENATSPYIAFFDADDFYLPNRFDADKRVFAENPEADGVYNLIDLDIYLI